ncbi:ATP-binding protein [Prevotella intermedia]|uniref:AAA family ATPase n=1 Tax=Prevotella intermedia TaxID=28131 RepID=UPI002006D306|nr:AAA family ATPase [Prevotella intermedia]MCK6144218.1 ATP-binding protein [Prevotella intermedia]
MAKITIKYVGPLKEVSLDIKRINVFMGPQSTGKSTIAKIISQALWAEKNFLIMGKEYDFYNGLLDFHNMDKNYFSNIKAEIVYESPWVTIQMKYRKGSIPLQTSYKKKRNKEIYHNSKIEYIPAERNFVASIENIHKYTESYNSTINFLNEWYAAKSSYQERNRFKVELPDLSFTYQYKESEERDIIQVADNEVNLQSGSSGQQSLLPLLLVAEEVMVSTYKKQRIISPAEISRIKKEVPGLEPVIDILFSAMKDDKKNIAGKGLDVLWQLIGYQVDYSCTHLVVEEPEQNLYPSTQRGLLQRLVSYLTNDSERQHTLTLTTHSPYILYALNNCMLAGLIEQKNTDAIEEISGTTRINPAEVGLWLLKDGEIKSLQHPNTGLLTQDFFNSEFQKNHEEMFQLLRLLPNESLSKTDTTK